MSFILKTLVFISALLMMQKENTSKSEFFVEGLTFGLKTLPVPSSSMESDGAEIDGEEVDGEMEKEVFGGNEEHPEYVVRASPKMYMYYDYTVPEVLEKFSSRMGKEFYYSHHVISNYWDPAGSDVLKKAVKAYNKLVLNISSKSSSNRKNNAVDPLSYTAVEDSGITTSGSSSTAELLLGSSPEFGALQGKRVRFIEMGDDHVGIVVPWKGVGIIVGIVVPDNQGVQKYGSSWRLNRFDRERGRREELREKLKSVAHSMRPANVLKSVTGGNSLLRSSRSNDGGEYRLL